MSAPTEFEAMLARMIADGYDDAHARDDGYLDVAEAAQDAVVNGWYEDGTPTVEVFGC